MYTSIQKTSTVDLSVTDKSGWTAAHHAVCSLSHATFDNAEIVYILAKAGAPLEAKNNAGETVMDLAQKTDAENIVKVLNKLLVEAPYNKEPQPFVRVRRKHIFKLFFSLPLLFCPGLNRTIRPCSLP